MVTAVLYWRRPDAFYNPQFWAEDGNVFFTDAFFLGVRSLVTPYAGYFHTLTRLVAWLGSGLPIRYAPHWYLFASWLMFVFIIGYLFSARFPFSNRLKFLMSLALVVTTADNEVYFNLANWATITSFIWLLLAISDEPKSRLQAIFDVVLLFLAGLNSPFSVCLWLLFLGRWLIRRTNHSLALWLLSLLVAFIQVWHMPSRIVAETGPLISLPLLLEGIVYHFSFLFVGEQIYARPLTTLSRISSLIMMLGLVGYLFWYAIRKENWNQLTILLGGILAAILSFYVMRYNPHGILYSTGRHFYIPAVTFLWALLLSADSKKWLLLFITFIAFLFLTPGSKNQILPDLDWAGQTANCTSTQPLCVIPINPVLNPPVWYVALDSHVFDVPTMQVAFTSRFGEQIELLGYDAVQDINGLNLQLVWHSLGKMEEDYNFFIHLFNLDNPDRIVLQKDLEPLNGKYPASLWVEQEIIVDSVTLPLHIVPAGQYLIKIGWYHPETGARLAAYDAYGEQWENDEAILSLTVGVDGNE